MARIVSETLKALTGSKPHLVGKNGRVHGIHAGSPMTLFVMPFEFSYAGFYGLSLMFFGKDISIPFSGAKRTCSPVAP